LEIIKKYFPGLTAQQENQLQQLLPLYTEWNAKINVISRKDIDNLYLHHILHSLAIAKWIGFSKGSMVMDIGSGGGFPGLPLAILFPDVEFHLVDSIGKKLKVVDEIALSIGLTNIKTFHNRAENVRSKYDFILCRAVAPLPTILSWIRSSVTQKQRNAIPNGLIALKGGNIDEEVKPLKKREYMEIIPLKSFYQEPYYDEKYLIYVQLV
jgi:16S rRNA (guanine527-N7)-methyltransferase